MDKKSNNNGCVSIEVVFVMAIILVISVIAIPVLMNFTSDIKNVVLH